MKNIIVATDFSPAALNACHYAANMAMTINADLVLLHVYQIPVIYAEVPVAMTDNGLKLANQKELNGLKSNLMRNTADKLNIKTVIAEGSFFQGLKAVCEKEQPYCVIIGSQGKTASERFLFGSNAVHTMKNLAWPLITVPVGAKFSDIKKIGLACDLEHELDASVIDEIKLLANDFNASLHVVNTDKPGSNNPGTIAASISLEKMLHPVRPVYHFTSNENIDTGILDFAEKNNIDLLLVLPKRYSLLEKLIHKSHTKQLVLHSHVPVMALHE